ncbi:MAG: NADH-quinone oxidoreductase subunit J [Coxiellaceae bacterium]|nr:NADH-quinone oxidoreductase subunit J [Coxiellaceae bacterium]
MIPIHQIIFFVFAVILIASALMVIISRNPVRAALFLVLTFFCSAVLWMMLQAEFLALALIFVYVGAVMTLLLFVVMMLNIDVASLKDGFVRSFVFVLLGVIVSAALVWVILSVIGPMQLNDGASITMPRMPADYSNVKAMGMLLYTQYLYPFELAAVILLVAIIAAISLAFFGRKKGTKSQVVSQQLKAKKADRLRVVNLKADKKS